jgi:O-antigen/teichoic acid export membrane protein
VTGRPGEPTAEEVADQAEVGHLARRGALWGVIAQAAQQVLSVAATMVLARLLTPADFGLVTASVTVLQFVQLVLALGWQAAIVRRRTADDEYLSSVFWVVSGMGVAIAAVVALAAPFLTGLMGVPDAAGYLMVLGLSCIPGAALVVPQGILQRRLQLRTMHLTYIRSFVAWAVIIGMVAQALAQLAGLCLAARWRPRLVFRRRLVGEDLRFAGGLLVNNGLTYGVRNADYVVVGNLLGAASLGAYYVAYVLPQILRLRVTWAAGAVLYPVLARSQDDRQRTREVYDHTHLLLAWVGFPAMVGLAVLAEPVVRVFFGSQWGAAVAPLRWLALVALLEFITFGPPMVATAHGRVRPLLVTNVVRLVLLLAAVAVAGAVFRTIAAVAAGVFVATLLWAFHQQLTLARPLGLPFAPLLKGLAVFAGLSGVMGAVVLALLVQLDQVPAVVQLAACTLAGAAVYLGLGRLLFPGTTSPLLKSVKQIVRSGGAA